MTATVRNWIVGVGVLACMLGGQLAHANLVSNGGFESGDFSGWTDRGLTGSNYVVDTISQSPHGGDFSGIFGATSDTPGETGGIEQTLATTIGHSYLVEFWLSNLGGSADVVDSWFSWSLDLTQQELLADSTPTAFIKHSATFTATNPSTVLSFDFRHDSNFWVMDDVSVTDTTQTTTVPEPGTLALLVFALGALALRQRKGWSAM